LLSSPSSPLTTTRGSPQRARATCFYSPDRRDPDPRRTLALYLQDKLVPAHPTPLWPSCWTAWTALCRRRCWSAMHGPIRYLGPPRACRPRPAWENGVPCWPASKLCHGPAAASLSNFSGSPFLVIPRKWAVCFHPESNASDRETCELRFYSGPWAVRILVPLDEQI